MTLTIFTIIIIATSFYTGWYFGEINGAKTEKSKTTKTKTIKSRSKPKRKVIIRKQEYQEPRRRQVFSKSIEKEISAICKWTVGRTQKLIKTIKSGGKGKKSVFCEEYKKRRYELKQENCKNKNNSRIINYC